MSAREKMVLESAMAPKITFPPERDKVTEIFEVFFPADAFDYQKGNDNFQLVLIKTNFIYKLKA